MSASDFEERIVTVPLRGVKAGAKQERADKSMAAIREHLAQHFKVETEQVTLSPSINEAIWSQGNRSPPSKIRVRAARFDEEGERVVEAEYADE